MPVKYQHTQKAGTCFYLTASLLIGLMASFVFFLILIIRGEDMYGKDQIGPIITPIAWVIAFVSVVWAALVLSSLTVRIDGQHLHVAFGKCVFRKKFLLGDIQSCRPVRNGWWWGWGIRWYFTGWLYTIAGFKSVEIILQNGKKRRIGTDEPEKLARAIQDAISS